MKTWCQLMIPVNYELEDKVGDWEYDNPFVGRRVRGLYENGWLYNEAVCYNKLLAEYVIHYSNGSRDFVKD